MLHRLLQKYCGWTGIVLALLFVSLVAEVAEGGQKIKSLKEVLRETEKALGVTIDPLVLNVRVTDRNDNLLGNAQAFVRSGVHRERLAPEAPGVFVVRVSRAQAMSGSVLEVHASPRSGGIVVSATFLTHITRSSADDLKPSITVLDLKDAKILGDSKALAVYYFSKDQADAAADLLHQITKARPVLKALLGAQPRLPFGMVLTEQRGPLRIDDKGIWPYSYLTQTREEFVGLALHEWSELSLNDIAELGHDAKNRWISDGLAELLSYRLMVATGDFETLVLDLTGDLRTINRMLGSGKTTFDLTDFRWPKGKKRSFARLFAHPEGYPLSRVLFLALTDEVGDELITEAVAAFAALRPKRRKNDTLIDILSDIVGRPLKDEVRSLDVDQARQMLARLHKEALLKVAERATAEGSDERVKANALRVLKRAVEDEYTRAVLSSLLHARQEHTLLEELL